jgi:hypothetical protein
MDGEVMRLEDLLKHVPDRVPDPPAHVTARVRELVLGAAPARMSRSRGGALLFAAAVVVGAVAFGAGYWTGPTHAAPDLTIGVRPDVVPAYRSTEVTLFGSVPSGRPGESVDVEANECGQSGMYHELEGVRTEGQGVWSLAVPHYVPGSLVNNNRNYVTAKTSFRVKWNGRTSEVVTVSAVPAINIYQFDRKVKAGKRRFVIIVIAPKIKYRPRVIVERRAGAEWKKLATVAVPITTVTGGRAHAVKLWLRAAKGQVLRARITAGEAAPCYGAEAGPPTRPVQ